MNFRRNLSHTPNTPILTFIASFTVIATITTYSRLIGTADAFFLIRPQIKSLHRIEPNKQSGIRPTTICPTTTPIYSTSKSKTNTQINYAKENNHGNGNILSSSLSTETATPEDLSAKFLSYASNIGRTRKQHKRQQKPQSIINSSNHKHKQKQRHHIIKELSIPLDPSKTSAAACLSAVRSLLHTMQSVSSQNSDRNVQSLDDGMTKELKTNINQALVQAVRAASDFGDYVLIGKIVDAAVDFSKEMTLSFNTHGGGMSLSVTHSSDGYFHVSSSGSDESSHGSKQKPFLVLESRFFGEAISELSKTQASASKLKKVWTKFLSLASTTDPIDNEAPFSLLATEPSAFELNAMMKGLASRGKIRAALDLYKHHADTSSSLSDDEEQETKGCLKIESDEYTASTLFGILADSISDLNETDEKPTNNISSTQNNRTQRKHYSKRKSSSVYSPCWQWKEVESVLDDFQKMKRLNNHIFAAALKVNERATEVYNRAGNRHYGAKFSVKMLERMQSQELSPDVVTCSAVMSSFDKGHQWRAAVALLQGMTTENEEKYKAEVCNDDDDDARDPSKKIKEATWKLPPPNEYTYATAISSCARCGQYDEAIGILDQMRNSNSNEPSEQKVVPNSWVYNAALSACSQSTAQHGRAERIQTAVQIVDRMEEDASAGYDTEPDLITYNTLLATFGNMDSASDNYSEKEVLFEVKRSKDIGSIDPGSEHVVFDVLEKIASKGLKRDSITYRNAILACMWNSDMILKLLNDAWSDSKFLYSLKDAWGSIDKGKTYLIHAAMRTCGKTGNLVLLAELFKMLRKHEVPSDKQVMNHLIKSVAAAGSCEDLMIALNAMKGDVVANNQFLEKFDIDLIGSAMDDDREMIEEIHYSSAITGSLRHGELFIGLKILNAMKIHGLTPNEASLQGIILGYCKVALDAASEEFREARKEFNERKKKKTLRVKHVTSQIRASAALAMMESLSNPPMKLQASVSSACAASGMYTEAREILWKLHVAAKKEKKVQRSVEPVQSVQNNALKELPRLHRCLLKHCARSGNVTAALYYVDAIQDLDSKLSRREKSSKPSHLLLGQSNGNFTSSFPSNSLGVGMGGEDWKLLMIAASKSAHWKVCVGTLEFMKPYLERTHPKNIDENVTTGLNSLSSSEKLHRDYENLARALTAAILAFETRSQYAWAVRSIDDWIEWSGRRPRREAVFAACRVLAARSKGSQVVDLIRRVLLVPPSPHDTADERPAYETAIYTTAITSLHKRGMYDNADELYISAVADGHLPWTVMETEENETQLKLDLHGMNSAIAHAAVRVSLQHLVQDNAIGEANEGVIIVTGRGKRSAQYLRPVLRPEVQRMLVEEFYPPLSTSSVPGNMGALSVTADDVFAWTKHQREQKSARLVAAASILKALSTVKPLTAALSQKISKSDNLTTS